MFLIILATLYISVLKSSIVKMFLRCQLILATLNSLTKASGVIRPFHTHLQVLGQCDQQGQHPPTHPPPPLPPHRQRWTTPGGGHFQAGPQLLRGLYLTCNITPYDWSCYHSTTKEQNFVFPVESKKDVVWSSCITTINRCVCETFSTCGLQSVCHHVFIDIFEWICCSSHISVVPSIMRMIVIWFPFICVH